MAIQILSLPVAQPGPSPIASLLGGFQTGQQLAGQYQKNQAQQMQNQAQQLQNQALPQLLSTRQALLNAQLQGANTANQYNPQIDSARLALMQSQLNPASSPVSPMGKDLADLQAISAKYGPNSIQAQTQQQYINAQLQQMQASQARFGNAYQLKQALSMMSPATRATWIAQNPQKYNNMLSVLSAQFAPPSTMPSPSSSPVMPQGNPIVNPSSTPSSGQINAPVTSPVSSAPTTPVTTSGSSAGTISPDVAAIQRASELSANQDLTTAATRRQQEGGSQVMAMLNSPQYNSQIQSASQYAGALGKGQAAIDALNQSNPTAYVQYQALKTQTLPLILNRIKSLDAMGATDAQREELTGLYNSALNNLTSNPQRFMDLMGQLKETLGNVDASVNASAQPLFNVQRTLGANVAPNTPVLGASTTDGAQNNGQQRVTVISPTGQTGTLPIGQLSAALQAGYKRG